MDNINCFTFIKSKLNEHNQNERFVDKIKINNVNYIFKKEIIKKKYMYEYLFYKKNSKIIKKYNFLNFINIPLKVLYCINSYIYIFKLIDHNFNKNYIAKINIDEWIDYTIQLCLIFYYLNHKLKMFHNDFQELRNIMIKDNKDNKDTLYLVIDDFIYTINSNNIVLIDFGQCQYKQSFKTVSFYYDVYKNFKKNYKFISEVLMAFFYSYYFFFIDSENNVDIKNNIYAQEYFNYFYNIFLEKVDDNGSLEDFDINIINSLLNLTNNNI